jgi:hypothetical protein
MNNKRILQNDSNKYFYLMYAMQQRELEPDSQSCLLPHLALYTPSDSQSPCYVARISSEQQGG